MQIGFGFEAPRRPIDLDALCDQDERAVAQVLQPGRANARQVRALAMLTSIPPRRVQEIVEHLILFHQVPIGTSMGEPFGNYLIDTAEDLAATEELLRSRGISQLARAAALRRMELGRYLELVQTRLEVDP